MKKIHRRLPDRDNRLAYLRAKQQCQRSGEVAARKQRSMDGRVRIGHRQNLQLRQLLRHGKGRMGNRPSRSQPPICLLLEPSRFQLQLSA